jgi:hypothetical protein
MSKQAAVETYADRFDWSRRDVVSYVRDLVELFGGVEQFAKGLLCREASIEQVLRGDAPPEYVIFHLGIKFDNKSGKYFRVAPPEIYQLADGVMPLHPHEWLELITLRIEVERLKERVAKSSDVSLADENEHQRREISLGRQAIDRLSRENARIKRQLLESQGFVTPTESSTSANDDPDAYRLTLFRQVYDTSASHVAFCDQYGLSRSYVYKVIAGSVAPGSKCDRAIADAIKVGQNAQRLDVVALCQEEIREYSTYMEFSAKFHLSKLSALNMIAGRIAQPRSKWRPVIEAALKRRAEEARDAA